MLTPTRTNPFLLASEQAALGWMTAEEQARQDGIALCRSFYYGDQSARLTDRLREFLQADVPFRLNVCRTVVAAVSERLVCEGVTAPDQDLSTWAETVWHRSRMDAAQSDAHVAALRDGESFVIVDWDGSYPRLTVVPRYVEATTAALDSADPDVGYGVRIAYPDDDPLQPPLWATKRWSEQRIKERTDKPGAPSTELVQRLTVYLPDEIRKYERRGQEWVPFQDATDPAWPLRWVDRMGQPLGVPVVQLSTPQLSAEHWEAIPVQQAINKALLDLITSGDMSAFRTIVALGWQPLDANGSPIKVAPGRIIGTTTPPGEASVTVIDPVDLSGLVDVVESLVKWTAMVTDTPVSRFQVTRQGMSADSQQEGAEPFLAKCGQRQTLFGNGWERVMTVAHRIDRAMGGRAPDRDDGEGWKAVWKPLIARDRDKELDRATKLASLGVPLAVVLKELGYDDAIIALAAAERAQRATATAATPAADDTRQEGRRDV